MRHSIRLTLLLLAVGALFAVGSDATASIVGVVSTPKYFCAQSGSSSNCGFPSMQPTYAGHSVDTIYVDFNQTSGTLSAKACEQSWSGATLNCNTPTSSSTTGYNDMSISGFSAISAGSGSVYDYYFVNISSTGSYSLLGLGYQ